MAMDSASKVLHSSSHQALLAASRNYGRRSFTSPPQSRCGASSESCSWSSALSCSSRRADEDDVHAVLGSVHMNSCLKRDFLARASAVRSETSTTSEVEALLNSIKWDRNGLVVAIAQDIDTGAILMQGFADRDAVAATLQSHLATFYSRSRATLWTKGETSSNFIHVLDVFLDCDRDSIIYLGVPDGPTCHTGTDTCYFTSAADILGSSQLLTKSPVTTIYKLENTIKHKKLDMEKQSATSSHKPSWTKVLLEDKALLCSKIREEADELCRSFEDGEGKDRTSAEFADLLYHALVLLAVQDVNLKEVVQILRARFSQSGIEEKRGREPKL